MFAFANANALGKKRDTNGASTAAAISNALSTATVGRLPWIKERILSTDRRVASARDCVVWTTPPFAGHRISRTNSGPLMRM